MSGESFMMNYDMASFYAKRLDDVLEAQRDNGGITETAPFVGIADAGLGGGSGPIGWQTYGAQSAAWLFKYYGNRAIVEKAFPAMTRYVEFLDACPRDAIENGLGDWMPVEDSALPLTGLGFQHVSYLAYANMSAIVGNASQAAAYTARAAAIADALNTAFLDPASGVYAAKGIFNRTQCGQSMPLFLQIVPPAAHDAAVAALVANLADHSGHLQVGSFGVKYLLMSLVDSGRADLAFGVMNKTDYPSFGFMLDENVNKLTSATTLWESWFTSDNTFSHDHPMCMYPRPSPTAAATSPPPNHSPSSRPNPRPAQSAAPRCTSSRALPASSLTRRLSRSTASSSSPRRRASSSPT